MVAARNPWVDTYPHRLPVAEVRQRLMALTDYWSAHYRVQTRWEGTQGEIWGRVLGVSFRGVFTIDPRQVRGELLSGFLGARLGGRGNLLRKLAHYLDPARSLEELRRG